MKIRPKYHRLLGLIPIFVLTYLLSFLSISTLNLCFLLIGYCLPYTIAIRDVKIKARKKRNRFSFTNTMLNLESFFEQYDFLKKNHIHTHLTPLIVCLAFNIISSNGFFVVSLIGGALLELNYYLYKKYLSIWKVM